MTTLTVGEMFVNMDTWAPFPLTNGVTISSLSSSQFVFDNGYSYKVTGSFSYVVLPGGGIQFTGGTVSSIQCYAYYDPTHIQVTITTINQPLLTLINLASQDVSQFNNLVFAGNDTLTGGIGYDNLYGLAGNDTMHGGDFFDMLSGGNGADALYGDNDTDSLFGDAGNDCLYGGNDNDSLVGDAGNDSL